jgi:membrane fusion protein, multidrug efflux system
MHKSFSTLLFAGSLFVVACNQGGNTLEQKKKEVQALKDQLSKAEAELAKIDTTTKKENTKLVAITPVTPGDFTHYIDLQGKVDALNIANVAPANGAGGAVKAIYVKQGDRVKKGQLLLKVDDALQQQSLATANQQMTFAQDLYKRRKNLWDQKIGSEVDYLTAKDKVDQAQEAINLAKKQIDLTNVYAEISGVADQVNVRLGEAFTGANQIRIVNTENLKTVAQVPEVYLGKVGVGSAVNVLVPELNNKLFQTRISVAGKLIDPSTRSFYIEARLPENAALYPNEVTQVRIQDYTAKNAITIPINTLQTDEKGKYVMVLVKEGEKMRARKKPIQIGKTYGDRVEILSGLVAGDNIITDGYQQLYDGQPITTQTT